MNKADVNNVTASVVIPTLNRSRHLKRALHSLLVQKRMPDEIIVVDQSDDCKTENLIISERPIFLAQNVSLNYVREKIKSITHARNVGMHMATRDIVFFLDDDILPDKHYISEILKVYREHPNATGVQGVFTQGPPYEQDTATRSILLNYLRKVFLITHLEKNTQRVLPSGSMVAAYPLTKTIKAEIILPAISSFKREIAKDFYFDENLKGYSWQEEYFTIKLNQFYPDSLYVTPFAKAVHEHASIARPTDKQFYYISTAYELYNFVKNIDLYFENWIAFYWKCIGKIVITLLGLHHKENRTRLFYILQSYLWTIRHFHDVKKGRFDLI